MPASAAAPILQKDMEPFPGYRLRCRLGRGGFAEVWEAHVGGTVTALKFLPCTQGATTRQELRSIEAVRQLEHPNLIRIDRVWCQPGYIVIAMEKADCSLLDLLKLHESEFGTPVAAEDVCELLVQAAKVIDFLNAPDHPIHGCRVGIQHRDVKPSNLLLVGNTVKLSDFGLASFLTASTAAAPRAGTVEYAAPEVFQGRLSDRTDQYALAVTYCHLRTGQLPFPETVLDFDRRYVRPAPKLDRLLPRERPIVARALAPKPGDRWPSCREFIGHLAKIIP